MTYDNIYADEIKPEILKTISNVENQPVSYFGFLVERAVRGFQIFISPVDGDRCTMKPTCSVYSRKAIRKHGAVIGLILTFDRLLHEGNEFMVSPITIEDGKLKTIDDVSNNTFWWKKGEEGR